MNKKVLILLLGSLIATNALAMNSLPSRCIGASYLALKYGLFTAIGGSLIATVSAAGQPGKGHKEMLGGAVVGGLLGIAGGGVHGFTRPDQAAQQAVEDFGKLMNLLLKRK